MSRMFTKSLVAASALALLCGAAQARNFFAQAGIDIGNGAKAIANAVSHPSVPSPAPPTKPAPGQMSPCTSAPGACGTAPKG